MTAARTALAALCGFLLLTPFAYAQGRRSGSSGGSTVTITYTYRYYTYGSCRSGGAGSGAHGPDMSVLTHRPVAQGYQWFEVVGTDEKVWHLFRGQDRIGQYDAGKEMYCRVNTDGTLSDPAPRPWRTNPGTIPAPPPTLPKPKAAARPAPEPELAQGKAPGKAPQKTAENGAPIEESSSGELLDGMPNWMLYSAGGGLAGLALVFGLMAQGRRGAAGSPAAPR